MNPKDAKKSRAASLVYTIIIVTVMLVTVSGTVDSILRANRQYVDLGRSDQAEAAARSLMERAFLEVTTATDALGYETATGNTQGATVTQELFDTNGDGEEDVYGTYEIWARSKKVGWRAGFVGGQTYASYASCDFSNLCIAPIPGTGNAGDECNFTDVSQGWAQPTTPTTGLEDDCNWNKLHYGEVVSFPLYYADATMCPGDGICNPAEAPTMGTFTLRVRTPGGETLSTVINLNEDEDGDTNDAGETDPVVVNWEITGDCDTATPGFPNGDEVADESCWMIGGEDPSSPWNPDSFINASDVNTVLGNEVVTGASVGEMWNGNNTSNILDFLTTTEVTPPWNFEILNPLLTISVVTPLENASNLDPIPYLEYQIQVDKPITDSKAGIHAIGKAEGKLGTYVWPLLDYLGIAENPLVQFVIQN